MKLNWSTSFELVASNIAVIAIAQWRHWPLVALLWPYWLQSVMIGWYTRRRVLSFRQFSLDETVVQPSEVAEAIKRQMATAFSFFYGVPHVLFFFLLLDLTDYPATPLDVAGIGGLGVAFLFVHHRSYARIMESDRAGRPNILVALTLIPVMRVLPMHVTVVIGLKLLGGTGAVILFGALKTLADVLMHWIEQRVMSAPTSS
jgi:hypothetical protein